MHTITDAAQRIFFWQSQLHLAIQQQKQEAKAFKAFQAYNRGLGDGAFGIVPSPEDAQNPDYMAGYEKGKKCW